MTDVAYDGLADVYEWLVPDALLTPEGTVAAFGGSVSLPRGGRVLDCACGIGQLAVGLALCGFDVVASDASPAMGALLDPSGKATTTTERLSFWPFTHTDLDEELQPNRPHPGVFYLRRRR
jgi:2-polyprenyl-3-methyl-5-hydroxy-6-metoxy-1,4-benzoquinol methylase